MVGARHLYGFFRFCFLPDQRYVTDESAKTIDELAAEINIRVGGQNIKLSEFADTVHADKMSPREKEVAFTQANRLLQVPRPADRVALRDHQAYENIRKTYWKPTDISEEEAREIGRI